MDNKNILLVGCFDNHIVGSKVELLKAMGYNVHALEVRNYQLTRQVYGPTSVHTFKECENKIISEIKEIARNFGVIDEGQKNSNIAKHLIEKIKPDIIWGIWGAGILKWLRTFRRIGFRGKMVLTINVFPNRIKLMKWSSEGVLYNKWLHKIDGLILTGRRMLEFIRQQYPKTEDTKYLLLPDYLPKSWFTKKVNVLTNNNEPHVVYLGSPERYGNVFSWGGIDNVDSHLLQIAENAIHVHCSKPRETIINHPLIHFYEPFSDVMFVNGEFGRFINQFDAAIVLYNRKGYHPRFASTFPTRFLVALCGCIPIFVKKGLLFECEEFIDINGIGKTYEDARELKNMLTDHTLIHKLRKKTEYNSTRFVSDNIVNITLLKGFFETL